MKNTLPLVLLVSENPKTVSLFKEALKSHFSLIQARESGHAFELLKTVAVEVLILEHTSLTESLDVICKTVRKITKGKNLPILFIPSSRKQSIVLDALSIGVTDFIHEPLDPIEINERVTVCVHSRSINKKMKLVESKIKTSTSSSNSKPLLEKTLIRDQTLKAISTAKKGAVPLSVLMIHLDSFSKLQEMLGEVSSFLEAFLKGRLRKYDTFIMEGPGQYLILLPKTSQSASKLIAEGLRKEISASKIKTSIKEILVTVSIGVVSFEKELSKSAKDFEQFNISLEKVKNSLIRSPKKGTIIISKT